MDDAEARAILREHGEEPPKRGKLTDEWRTKAESLRMDHLLEGDDYDGGVSAEDFSGESVTEAAEPPPLPAEQKPRRVKRARKPLRERIAASTAAKPKRKHPRVSVAPLVSEFWGLLGGMAVQVDRPLGTCLQLQAPVAGVVLEDVVKGTIVDRGLQPLARAEDKAKKVAALVMPPLCVAGLEMAQRLPDDQRKQREAILYPVLIQSLILSERVAGEYAEQIMEQVQRDGPARERAENTARLIFGEAPQPADRETVPA